MNARTRKQQLFDDELFDDASRILRFRVRHHMTLGEMAAAADVDERQLFNVARGVALLDGETKTKVNAFLERWKGH